MAKTGAKRELADVAQSAQQPSHSVSGSQTEHKTIDEDSQPTADKSTDSDVQLEEPLKKKSKKEDKENQPSVRDKLTESVEEKTKEESSEDDKKTSPKEDEVQNVDSITPSSSAKAPKRPKKKSDAGPSTSAPPKPPNRSVLQLKITLRDITPPIWRRIQVLNNTTFFNLKNDINEVMGWRSDSSHRFIVENPRNKQKNILIVGHVDYDFASDRKGLLKEENTKLNRFLNVKGDRLLYEFAMGDGWLHEVVVERVLPPPPPKAEYPKCITGKRACPPEDCGGVDGYNHLMEVFRDKNHPEYQELVEEWLEDQAPGWDPEKFEKKGIFKKVWMWVKTR